MPTFPRLAREDFAAPAPGDDPLGPPQPPAELRRKFERLQGQRIALLRDRQRKSDLLAQLTRYLDLAPQVDAALEKLSQDLFGRLATIIEQHLTLALQEVLQQPITLKVERDFKRGAATMSFYIERDGQEED